MPFPTDGVYTIKNTGRDLMLDLRNNSTAEGNQIQGYAPNGTVAQQWVIKRQNEPGSRNKSVTIQSNNSGNNGNGCFTASEDSDEPVIYTRQAFIVDLIGRADNTFTMSFTQGNNNLVVSIPSAKHNEVKLENFVEGSSRQQWEFIRVSDLHPIVELPPLDISLQWYSRLSYRKSPHIYVLLVVSASVVYYALRW